MKCSKIRRLMPGYVDRELAPAIDDQVRKHLSGCAACKTEEEQLQKFTKLLNAWNGVEPRLGYEALGERIARRTGKAPTLGVPSWAAAALAVIGIAGGVTLGFKTPNMAPRPVPTEQQVVTAIDLHTFDDVFESSIVRGLAINQAGEETR